MTSKSSDFQIESDEEDAMSKSQDSILSAMKPRKTGLDALGFKHVAAERNVAPTTGSTVNHDEIKKNAASIATGAVRDISLRPIPQRNTILGANRMSEWGTPAMKASVSAQSEHDAPKSKKLQLKNIIVSLRCIYILSRSLLRVE